jgi:hypothetical protein
MRIVHVPHGIRFLILDELVVEPVGRRLRSVADLRR